MHTTSGHLVRYYSFAKITSISLAFAGLLVVVGWIADIRLFKSLLPESQTIKFNAGLGMFLCGLSLRLLLSCRRGSLAWGISQVAAGLTILLGSLTVAEYLSGWDFGIDQMALPEHEINTEQYPGRMSLIEAMNFVLLGGALLLLGRNAAARWVEGLTLIAALNALVPAIGYLYGKAVLYQLPYYGTITLSATVLYLLLCAAILASRPTRGLMAIVSNDNAGGITARRLLPAALLLPIAIDRLEFWGRQAGLYDSTFGMITLTLSSMVIFTLLIIWNAHLLMRLDQRRTEAEDALHESLDVLETNLNALTKTNTRLQAEKSVRRAVEENLFHEHERAQVTLNSIADGVITTDLEGRITYLNRAAERFSGWSNKEACGRLISEIFKIVDLLSRQPNLLTPQSVLQQDSEDVCLPRNSILLRRDGSELAVEEACAPMHDRDGKVVGVVLVLHDVSAVHAMSQRMSHLTQHDVLTDLPNRFLLNDRLTQAIALALRHGTRTAVLFLDLDRFKQINDTLSHKIGDRLLQDIALRLKRCVRDTDTVSRHGGDAFVLLLQEVSDSLDAARTAAQVLKSITEPYSIEGHEIHISASIGISICPEDGEDAETILMHAEAAMYQAKAQGRNNYQFFTRHINELALKRFTLERNLRRAIAREESVLYYQPKFRIADQRVIGAEALIRWNNRQDGVVSPTQFIPIAEESGLIIPIGEWVLRKACEQARMWQDANYPPFPVAVNVSAVQFREKHFLDLVARVLDETGLQPKYLELELTESVTMQDLELTVSLLESLKHMGIGLSIDDFGTGYSSLSYLKRFPIDTLKIDRSFVQDITTDPDSAAIISAIISLAKSLKQEVIAEGVETQEQFEFLRKQGCDAIQGYYCSKPLTPKEFEERILQHTTTTLY